MCETLELPDLLGRTGDEPVVGEHGVALEHDRAGQRRVGGLFELGNAADGRQFVGDRDPDPDVEETIESPVRYEVGAGAGEQFVDQFEE